VIRLGLRLTIATGREALTRLVIIAAAVAIGVGLLLATVAGINAVNAQNARYAWLNTGIVPSTAAPSPDPLWWTIHRDYFDGRPIGRIDLAATGPRSPVPPGIPRLPGPGEFYASPELSRLLASTPPDELADRFPGHQVGTIGPEALPAPNFAIIVVGHRVDELSHQADVRQVSSIANVPPGDCNRCEVGVRADGMDLILGVVAAALLFPVLIFIGAATRLTATRREQRFAAMRLVGATPRQISVIAAVESTIAALAGTVAGFALFLVLRRPLAAIPFTGTPFYPGDLSLNLLDIVLVGLGVPVGAALAARIALRRVRISPLGVSRRITPRAPRAYRLIPLLVGLGELGYLVGNRPHTTNGQLVGFLGGILLTMAGLVVAGPWLTMVGARVLASRSRRPATLIAARRLADNPKAGFRAISGLVLALFVTSVAIGVITTIVANRGFHPDGTAASTTLSKVFFHETPPTVPDSLTAELRSTTGVRSVVLVHRAEGSHGSYGVTSCAELERDPALGRCAEGAATAEVWENLFGPGTEYGGNWRGASTVWPASSMSVEELQRLPVLSIVVNTAGTTAAVERARTILELAFPEGVQPPTIQGDFESDFTRSLNGWQQLTNVVILASLPIAGCSLAVSVAGGLSERKRPFSLLRLSGAPLRVLRRVVAFESAVPLLIVAAVAIGTGFLAAQLFLTAQMGYTLRPPGAGYYLIVLAGLAASLGIIASTLPLLERITGPETARNE
jgi:hypothetical protein